MTADELRRHRNMAESMRKEIARGVGKAIKEFQAAGGGDVHPDILRQMTEVSKLNDSLRKLEGFFNWEMAKQGVVE